VVSRGRRGRLVLERHFDGQEELDVFLRAYEERHAKDRARLGAMTRYGQTTLCRGRVIQAYFGEDAAHDCGHCDNCASGVAARAQAVAAAAPTRAPARASRGSPGR
jgi:ATP-dependent DNA helicase RecQ